MEKLCQCGCGDPTNIIKKNARSRGLIKGEPYRFLYNHEKRMTLHGQVGDKNRNWKGGRHKETRGYVLVYSPNHPHPTKGGYVRIHRLQAEKAIGKILPLTIPVHHYSETQLVICQDHTYHKLLHVRTRAYRACGHASWKKCPYCKRHDSTENMIIRKMGKYIGYAHQKCKRQYEANRQNKNKSTTILPLMANAEKFRVQMGGGDGDRVPWPGRKDEKVSGM